VVNEGSYGRYRVEMEQTAASQSYFLTVLQARDSSGQSLNITSSQDSNTMTVTLSHPTLGTAIVVFNKGATSTGGQFGYSTSGSPTLSSLYSGVQQVSVTDNGVSWVPVSGGDTTPPSPPGGVRTR